MCGGTLEIATCSHVGHVFRKSTPYTFPGGTSKIVNHNNARLAEVWLDQWKYFYYNINPGSTNTEETTEQKKSYRHDESLNNRLIMFNTFILMLLPLSKHVYPRNFNCMIFSTGFSMFRDISLYQIPVN